MAEAYRPNPLQWPLSPEQLVGLDDTLNDIYGRLQYVTTVGTESLKVSLSGNTSGLLTLISTGTMFLIGGSNITLSQSGQSVSLSVANPRPALSVGGNTSGALALISTGTAFFAGGNNITLSQNGQSITISGGAGGGVAVSLGGNTSGALGVISTGTMFLAGGNNVTLSQNGQSVTISAGTAAGVGITGSIAGNTSGVPAGISTGAWVLAGGNNITLSQNGSTVTISGPNTVAGGGVATVSQWPVVDQGWVYSSPVYSGSTAGTGGSTQFTVSGNVWSAAFPHQLEFHRIDMRFSPAQTSAGTGSCTIGQMLGIYTLNGNSALSLVSSFVWSMEVSQNSLTARSHRWGWGSNSAANSTSVAGNSSGSFSGARIVSMFGSNATLAAGNYYFAHIVSMRSSSINVYGIGSIGYGTAAGVTQSGTLLGESAGPSPDGGFAGVFSTTSNASYVTGLLMPASIHTSAITGTGGSTQWRRLQLNMFRNST